MLCFCGGLLHFKLRSCSMFPALFGILFSDNQEAAFAVYRMCQSLGFAAAFGYSYFLCVRIKVYILGGVLIVSLVFYTAVEFKYQQSKKLCQGLVVL